MQRGKKNDQTYDAMSIRRYSTHLDTSFVANSDKRALYALSDPRSLMYGLTIVEIFCFYRASLSAGRSSQEKAVCLSVYQTRGL